MSERARKQKVIAPREPGDTTLHPDHVDDFCRPVRIEITFDDPIATRKQIIVLQKALQEAGPLTFAHRLGINRQRMNLRHVIKVAADTLARMNGKTPRRR